MADNDERGIVNAFNRVFDGGEHDGMAYRRKQSRFTSQFADLLVDTNSRLLDNLVIEHKSWKLSSSKKLYFSQHFSSGTEDNFLESTHQVNRVAEFAELTGRRPLLGVEVRQGMGNPKQLFFVHWNKIQSRYIHYEETGEKAGISQEWLIENAVQVQRESSEWRFKEKAENQEITVIDYLLK